MAKYMIHACPQRMWFVEDYLVPSMIEQGILESDIIVYNDIEGLGNLLACIDSFKSIADEKGGTWHLQDDVIISKRFKELTELNDVGIVYGFSGYYDLRDDKWLEPGYTTPMHMWSSFQCVRIPNTIVKEYVEWFEKYMLTNPVYTQMLKRNKGDDWLFMKWLQSNKATTRILNLAPNIVEHIDQLIGGSVINTGRPKPDYTARFWEEPETTEKFKRYLLSKEYLL